MGPLNEMVLGDDSPPVASRGQAPVGVWGRRSPPEPESVCMLTLFTDFESKNDQNLKISHDLPPDS